ncbi:MAG: hypothetical protein IKQ43_09025 [Treponema sp.]|nr:hypothetical protein [Treponema sp.]
MVRRSLIFCAAVFILLLASCASKQEEESNVAVPPANIIRPLPAKNKTTVKPKTEKATAKTDEAPAQKKSADPPVESEVKKEPEPVVEPEVEPEVEEPKKDVAEKPVSEPEPVYEDPDVAPAALTFAVQTQREKAPVPIDDPEPEPVAKTQTAAPKTETKVQPKTEIKPKTETKTETKTTTVTTPKKETSTTPKTEVKTETKTPAKTEVKKEETKQDVQKNEEYERSVGKSTTSAVTMQVFEEDKKDILNIISKLDTVMKNRDYKSWLTYLNDESIRYWSNRKNLAKAESRLPVKGLQLSNLEDYFKYVFIPSRSGRRVDEIRYENDKQVKAVQVNGSTDVVYYNFEKNANGVWKLRLPSNSD